MVAVQLRKVSCIETRLKWRVSCGKRLSCWRFGTTLVDCEKKMAGALLYVSLRRKLKLGTFVVILAFIDRAATPRVRRITERAETKFSFQCETHSGNVPLLSNIQLQARFPICIPALEILFQAQIFEHWDVSGEMAWRQICILVSHFCCWVSQNRICWENYKAVRGRGLPSQNRTHSCPGQQFCLLGINWAEAQGPWGSFCNKATAIPDCGSPWVLKRQKQVWRLNEISMQIKNILKKWHEPYPRHCVSSFVAVLLTH